MTDVAKAAVEDDDALCWVEKRRADARLICVLLNFGAVDLSEKIESGREKFFGVAAIILLVWEETSFLC